MRQQQRHDEEEGQARTLPPHWAWGRILQVGLWGVTHARGDGGLGWEEEHA